VTAAKRRVAPEQVTGIDCGRFDEPYRPEKFDLESGGPAL
jgi:hypothetical protein